MIFPLPWTKAASGDVCFGIFAVTPYAAPLVALLWVRAGFIWWVGSPAAVLPFGRSFPRSGEPEALTALVVLPTVGSEVDFADADTKSFIGFFFRLAGHWLYGSAIYLKIQA